MLGRIAVLLAMATLASASCWTSMPGNVDFQTGSNRVPGTIVPTLAQCKAACEASSGCTIVHWCSNVLANGARAGECWGATQVNYVGVAAGCAVTENARVSPCPGPCPANSGCAGNKRYAVAPVGKTTWANAKATCRSLGGRLPMFNNAAETAAFRAAGVAAGRSPTGITLRAWMAMGDDLSAQAYRLQDGDGAHENNYQGRLISTGLYYNLQCQVAYCNWHSANPSGDRTKSEILFEDTVAEDGKWNDLPGNVLRDVVCEYDWAPAPTVTLDPAVSAFCDDIQTKCGAIATECTTLHGVAAGAVADDCDATATACQSVHADCVNKAAACPLV